MPTVLIVDDEALARTIVQLARTLRLSTVAEGIETPEQLSQLRDLGCEQGQGYYFAQPLTSDDITGLPADQADAMVFHAGTAAVNGQTITSGGRVLCVTVLADSVKQAQQKAYEVAKGIHFDGQQYRKDIGYRAIKT